MNQRFNKAFFWSVLIAIITTSPVLATETNQNVVNWNYATNPPPPRPEIVWGAQTNGMRCGISLLSWPDIEVYLQAPANYSNFPDPKTIQESTNVPPKIWPGFIDQKAYPWFGPTNRCLGYLELRDEAGELVPLRNQAANDPNCYPEFIRLSTLSTQIGYTLLGGVWEGFYRRADIQEAYSLPCQLHDLFEVSKPGKYTLTLWAKIYKCPEVPGDVHDVYKRIDLLPVSLPLQWPEGSLHPGH